MLNKKIRVLVVDDSLLFRKMLTEGLSIHPQIQVVGYAMNAFDAMRKIPALHPDVITLDVEMPGMSGIDFLKQLLPKHPIPVILVSSLNLSVFDALSAGAVDFVQKPDMDKQRFTTFLANLSSKIKGASMAKIKPAKTAPKQSPISRISTNLVNKSVQLNNFVIAIGASTGGTEATLAVLKDLPADTPGIVVVQHMPAGFTKMYAERLNRICKMRVKEAQNGDPIVRGQVLIAPGDFQMRVMLSGSGYAVRCTHEEKVSGHMPSVDVLFDSMAQNVTRGMGIILTGMGRDGANGLLKMHQKGFYTIGQSKESCVVYGMPMEAFKLGAVSIEAPCEKIGGMIIGHLNGIK